ncbi:TPA: hypothetical protein NKP32_004522 [Vibrio parahaemolyticus]|nr:hypothetical protein [Vibrio parahaemolyticus]
MQKDEIVEILGEYSSEIAAMLPRFSKTRDGLYIDSNDGNRFRNIVQEVIDLCHDHIPGSSNTASMIAQYYNQGISNWQQISSYASLEEVKGAIDSLSIRIERNPKMFDENPKIDIDKTAQSLDGLNTILNRFHSVAMQLRKRYSNRSTLDVNDEYDVQNLLHSLLKLHFADIRPEEWNPSYAGSSTRSDFLLPEVNTIIEVKKTRQSMTDKDLGDQLVIDIANYKKHPQCNSLICFVYDPEGRITNPRGIERDLSDCDKDIDVRTIIVPKHE